MPDYERPAQTIWDFMSSRDDEGTPTIVFVFGSIDIIVPAFAASVYFRLHPAAVICSGGIAHDDDLLNTSWNAPEGLVMSEVLAAFGVPGDIMHVDDRATNTGQNFDFSLKLAKEKGLDVSDVLVLHKPYATLRTRLTGMIRCPDLNFRVTAPTFSFDQYSSTISPVDKLLNIMVGDFQRIIQYPDLGFSARCTIPDNVKAAYQSLIDQGYTKHLLPE